MENVITEKSEEHRLLLIIIMLIITMLIITMLIITMGGSFEGSSKR